jgi:hypothetical protein
MRFLRQADVGTRTRDPLLTMEVLYHLSYVGANPNPSVIAADLDMILARNDHKCPVVPGGVFLAVLGAFSGAILSPEPVPPGHDRRQKPGQDGT